MTGLDHALTYLQTNLDSVKASLASAEEKAGRVGKTTVVAAVKYADEAELAGLLRLGVTDVGENRVQQLLDHWQLLEASGARVHFIGHLQKNKVKYIVDKVAMIHSLDSAGLAAEIQRQAEKQNVTVDVLLEINSGRETAKSGVLPEDAEALCREVLRMPRLRLRGFMTMAPKCESEAEYRRYFAETRALAFSLWQKLALAELPLLSMGMSESFAAAVAEGADMVRVGRRLFARCDEP